MANIPLLLLAVLKILVAAATQDVHYYPPLVPSGKTRKNPQTYHKYEGLHFSNKQCSQFKGFTNKPLEFCAGECDSSGSCTAFNYKELGGKVCSLIACGLNIPYPIGGAYGGYSAILGWSGYTVKEIPVGKTYYHGPYKYFFGHKRQKLPCWQLGPTLYDKTYGLCEEACDAQLSCTGFNFHIHARSGKCELRGCSSADSRPGEYLEGWEGWSKAEIKNPEPDPKCPSPKCSPKIDFVPLEENPDAHTISEFHSYPGLHFANHQCDDLLTVIEKTLDSCKVHCDKDRLCTAFNYLPGELNEGQICDLKECGLNPPYPVGSGSPWQGYSLQLIEESTTFYGPYRYWATTATQGCKQIGATLKDKTNILCEQACVKIQECTGFNIRGRDCELRGCGSPVTRPLGKLYSQWKGWSKMEIPSYGPLGYHKYEKRHFSTRQCREITSFKKKPLVYCAGKCADLGICGAFNYKEDGGECSLRACGANLPYPIGGVYSGVSAITGWSGYTLRIIPVGYTYYHGPYRNFFGDKTKQSKCGQLGATLTSKNYVICEERCDDKPSCTGYNFNIHNFKCELRDCSSAFSRPKDYLDDWESWSKAEIKNPEPSPKCPSPKCSAIAGSSYYGPYQKIFSNKQCRNIGVNKGYSVTGCEDLCNRNRECTAFNFELRSYKCVLRRCGKPQPNPNGFSSGWDGWSLGVIEGARLASEKCSGIFCGIGRYLNVTL